MRNRDVFSQGGSYGWNCRFRIPEIRMVPRRIYLDVATIGADEIIDEICLDKIFSLKSQ